MIQYNKDWEVTTWYLGKTQEHNVWNNTQYDGIRWVADRVQQSAPLTGTLLPYYGTHWDKYLEEHEERKWQSF